MMDQKNLELKAALAQTVATAFSVFKGSTEVASGSLGSDETLYLPEGDYRVELHSSPPRQMPISLAPRDRVTLTLEKQGGAVSHSEHRGRLPHMSCDDALAAADDLERDEDLHRPLADTTDY